MVKACNVSLFLWGALFLASCMASSDFEAGRSFDLRETAGVEAQAFDPQTGEPLKPAGMTSLLRFDRPDSAAGAPQEPAAPAQPPAGPQKRLMVYTADIDLLVSNVTDSMARFLKRVEERGGYLEERTNDAVRCRVPAEHFEKTMAELRTYGLVTQESTKALDVTRKHMDLSLRIETAEKARQRLLALLEKAEKVEDALKIESEVRRLTEEIEKLKGELRYLSEEIAFSTISARFRSNAPPPKAPFARRMSRFYWVNQLGVEHVVQQF